MSAAEQLLHELTRQGIEVWVEGDRLNYRAAAGRMSVELKERLREHKPGLLAALRRRSSDEIVPEPERLNEPFPLTDVQQAYWIGRDASYELGGVAAHSYVESEVAGLDIQRLEDALNALIARHDMLRMIVMPTGEQCILPDVPRYRVRVHDVSTLPAPERERQLLALRERMSHQVLAPDQWPLFEVAVSDLGDSRSRVHISLDLLIADAASVLLLVSECLKLYQRPYADLPSIGLSFRDYVLSDRALHNAQSEAWQESLHWWRNRIETLPAHPQIPLARDVSSLGKPRFVRRTSRLEPDEWRRLKARARQAALTPSMLLCAAYSDVLAAWSKDRRFTLNLTLFNRLPRHADVSHLVGDFTSGILLEVDFNARRSFEERARQLQDEFWKTVEHSRVSSVQVIRELARSGGAGRAAMPVVFTSLLQQDDGIASEDWSRSILYGVSQTPQVWLDHQVFELGGALVFNWDAVDDLFPADLLDDVFNAYCALLHKLADGDGWTADSVEHLPAVQAERRREINATDAPVPPQRLEHLFLTAAAQTPDAPAVISASRTLTYAELELRSAHLANAIAAHDVRPGEPVAIVMRKGWEQAVAALAILRAGGAYVPIEAGLPPERVRYLLEQSAVRLAVVQPEGPDRSAWPSLDAVLTATEDVPAHAAVARPAPLQDASDLAYIIYTSGSTGQPKGVMIDHSGAVNTIVDVNQRIGAGPQDRALALSALNFDLSVYDIFGMLACGGALVIPGSDSARSPEDWASLIARHNVTIWNSVPALMEMLVEHLNQAKTPIPASLRLIMMSGDWIPLSLPDRIRALTPSARMMSLGGATEASIWSICYPIERVDPAWKSIPYGRPMVNQRFYVLDSCLQDRPDHVPGELYIGGIGVALGYWRDEEKTRAQFIRHPETGERLYRTGDWGRTLPDGNIEFLGRDDNQVKVLGHRIELGEIEAALRQHPSVREAVVTAPGARERRRLVAHIVPATDGAGNSQTSQSDWAAVTNAVAARTDEQAAGIPAIAEFLSILDRVCTFAICATLRRLGVFASVGDRVSLQELAERNGISQHNAKVLEQWIGALVEDGIVVAEPGSTYQAIAPVPESIPLEAWAALEQHPLADPELLRYFRECFDQHVALLTGHAAPLELLFPGGSWQVAETLYQSNPASRFANQVAASLLHQWAKQRQGVIRVLEAGAGTGGTTAYLLEALPADRTRYTHTDVSTFFRAGAKEKFKQYGFIDYRLFDINKPVAEQSFEPGSFDVIVAANALHIASDVEGALKELSTLLAPDGLMLLVEGTRYPRYLMTTATGFLEGLGIHEDQDRPPLLPAGVWRGALEAAGYSSVAVLPREDSAAASLGLNVIAAQWNAPAASRFDASELRTFLRERLPDYMVPAAFVALPELPLTSNGKVDRNALKDIAPEACASEPEQSAAAATPEEAELAGIWAELLERDSVSVTGNFFELGGDSLLAVQLSARVRERMRVELPLRMIFENPSVRSLAAALAQRARVEEASEFPPLVPDTAARFEAFPLTGVQEAYWIGRTGSFELGNTPCQVYLEFESTEWDLDRLTESWNRVIERHEMLRARFLPDGRQRILPSVDRYDIAVLDLSRETPETTVRRLLEIQDEMAYRNRDAASWPLFEIRATRLDGGRMRLHVCIEALIADGWSLLCLFRDWNRFYLADAAPAPLEISFRDYVLARERVERAPSYQRSKDYWQTRIATLPPAPQLPLARNPESLGSPKFRRRTAKLTREEWNRFASRARELGLTASNALVSAFSEALATWSRTAHFTLNLTQFNRIALHRQVNDVVGDFTSLTLLEVNHALPGTFADRARRVQGQLADDLEHRHYGGIDVIRSLANRMGGPRALMPVVFTSMLNFAEKELNSGSRPHIFGDVVASVSQTPQVWLDHQEWEEDGRLVLSWDAIDELFPEGMLDAMFEAYSGLVQRLARDERSWLEHPPVLVPAETLRVQESANAISATLSEQCLHTLVEAQVRRTPASVAVKSHERELTYAQLWDLAQRIGRTIAGAGARPDSHIAVLMDKGWEQIPAVLGVLLSGAAYLPVDPSLPPDRIAHLLTHSQATAVITQPRHRDHAGVPRNVPVFCLEDDAPQGELPTTANPDHLAYTIYTSGSTGLPKGVAIDHRGAVNTILDINRRFGIGPDDRVLALSSLSFDLSVWDIFGTLAAGGTVVAPPAESRRDPDVWLRLLESERITVWNSVPALMRMLVEYAAGRDVPQSLRLVMMSGDWIPVPLPDQIRGLFRSAEVVSLGGATEASIWSIVYPIAEVNRDWPSIPYGKPMVNQRFYVLDDRLQPRPFWVPGELYIGGIGLAREYWRDPEKTAASFITHPVTGERLYRTGDLGRYLPDGNIEFLGREDFQVKIQGFRVELGEIESALESHPMVKAAAAAAAGDRQERRLVAYVVPSVAVDASKRLEMKLGHHASRFDNLDAVALPAPTMLKDEEFLTRRTHRRFDPAPLPLERLAEWLGCLRRIQPAGSMFFKYRYPSAGDLYAVETYVSVMPGRVAGLEPGDYFYDPSAHRLVRLSTETASERGLHRGQNQDIFDDSAVSLYFVADMAAVEPLYGAIARELCVLEAGYMGQLLMTAAEEAGIGACPIGAVNFEPLRANLQASSRHEFVHAILAGGKEQVVEEGVYTPSMPRAAAEHDLREGMVRDLREHLRQRLPEYMIPSSFVVLDELPLSSNGKVDRKALAAAEAGPIARTAPFQAPESPLEQQIGHAVREVLNLERVSVHDNFFELGATSMQLVQVGNLLRARLNCELPIVELFTHNNIHGLADYLKQHQTAEPQPSRSDDANRERGRKQRDAFRRLAVKGST